MPRNAQENWIETYLDYTASTNAPSRYHIWTALSVVATVVNRKVYLDRGFFRLFPNLYITLVGPTGFAKTTATIIGMNTILDTAKSSISPPLEVIQGKATSWYLYDWFGKMSATNKDCICTIYSGEMKDLFGDLNKTELITLLTDLYTSPDKKDFYMKTNKLSLQNVCINILTCTTPEWLTTGTTTNEIAGGFTGRFVYVYADSGDRSIAFPEDFMTADIIQLRQELIEDLIEIGQLSGQCVITDQAKAEYIIWYSTRKKEWNDERLLGYYARKGDLVLKLCILLSVAKDNTLVIDESTLHLVWDLLSGLELDMGSALSGIVDDPALKYKDMVLGQISRGTNNSCLRSDLLKKNWHKFDGVILDRIMTNLVDAHVVTSERKLTPNSSDILYRLKI